TALLQAFLATERCCFVPSTYKNEVRTLPMTQAPNSPRFIKSAPSILTRAVSAVVLSGLVAGSAWAAVGNPRVNQVGYLPNSAKIAIYSGTSLSALPWELRLNGNLVTSGMTVPRGVDAASGDNVHLIDISAITKIGRASCRQERVTA